MRKFLKEQLQKNYNLTPDWFVYEYSEDINKAATTDDWLKNGTSFIYRVGVLLAIDSNKFDFAYIAIGVQRYPNSEFEIKGTFEFDKGENDDIIRVLERAVNLIKKHNEISILRTEIKRLNNLLIANKIYRIDGNLVYREPIIGSSYYSSKEAAEKKLKEAGYYFEKRNFNNTDENLWYSKKLSDEGYPYDNTYYAKIIEISINNG